MADEKLSAIAALAALLGTDILYLVDDPGGSPVHKSITLDVLRQHVTGRLDKARRTSGNITVTSTTWVDLDTGLDLTLTGVLANDEVEVGLSGIWAADGAGFQGLINAVSLVSSSPVNGWGEEGAEAASGQGVSAWFGSSFNIHSSIGGSVIKTIVSGDLESGTLTIRFRTRLAGSDTRNLLANANNPLQVWAKNLGPVL